MTDEIESDKDVDEMYAEVEELHKEIVKDMEEKPGAKFIRDNFR